MKIGIYSGDDPRNPATWSGTPSNLIRAFSQAGQECETFHPNGSSAGSIQAKLIEQFSPGSAPYSKSCIKPRLDQSVSYFQSKNCNAVLHAPGNDVPYAGYQSPLQHCVFMDSTFRQYWVPWFRERNMSRGKAARTLHSIETRRRENFYRQTLTQVSHFFVTSPWVKSSLAGDYDIDPSKITVCYTGRGSVKNLHIERPANRQEILFVAKHNYLHKGAGLLLDAFRRARHQIPDANLIMVGPDPKDLQLAPNEERVTVHGFLEWADLEILFNTASVFAMPSLYEPYGLVYLEALGCGTPVICSATGGMASIVTEQNCGWALERQDPESLAQLLVQAINNSDERAERAANGLRFVEENCTWPICVGKIITELGRRE